MGLQRLTMLLFSGAGLRLIPGVTFRLSLGIRLTRRFVRLFHAGLVFGVFVR